MMKWVLASAMVLAVPAVALAEGDAEAGKAVFNKCGVCHKFGATALGPDLKCVFGRKAGTAEGFNGYSDALKNSGITWDDDKLKAWMENNAKMVPSNKMIFPAGIKDATDRDNLLAYIKAQCTQ